VHTLVGLGQLEERAVLRHAEVSDDQLQSRVALQQPGDRSRPGVRTLQRTRAAVDDHRCAGLLQPAPHGVEQRVTRVVPADLHVHLEDPRAALQRLRDVERRLRLGVERRRLQDPRVGRGELHRPVVEPSGHARLVRIRQRREGPHSQPVEDGEALVVRQRVGQRPRDAVVLLPVGEVLPHLGLHARRQEVDVRVDQPRETQLAPVPGDVVVVDGRGDLHAADRSGRS
jgi:hypothetical protein